MLEVGLLIMFEIRIEYISLEDNLSVNKIPASLIRDDCIQIFLVNITEIRN